MTSFYKYQGTGNDFIMIDNRTLLFPKQNKEYIALLCNRRFGIGADGLILLENHTTTNFSMVYFNSDGNESSMCGNGGRCLVAFAKKLGVIKNEATFLAIDGLHYASIENNNVALQMIDVSSIKLTKDYTFLNTGSPHHIVTVEDNNEVDVKKEGAKIRYSKLYQNVGGTNVNFVQKINTNTFNVRTYERGVENETLSCGTGVTAVALAMYKQKKTDATTINVETRGGKLQVSFKEKKGLFSSVFLSGAASFVFKGELPNANHHFLV